MKPGDGGNGGDGRREGAGVDEHGHREKTRDAWQAHNPSVDVPDAEIGMAPMLGRAIEKIRAEGATPHSFEQEVLLGRMVLSGDVAEAKVQIIEHVKAILAGNGSPSEKLGRIDEVVRMISHPSKPLKPPPRVHVKSSLMPFLEAKDPKSAAEVLVANKTALKHWETMETTFQKLKETLGKTTSNQNAHRGAGFLDTVMQERRAVNEWIKKLKEQPKDTRKKSEKGKDNKPTKKSTPPAGNTSKPGGLRKKLEGPVSDDALNLIQEQIFLEEASIEDRFQGITSILQVLDMFEPEIVTPPERLVTGKRPTVLNIVNKEPVDIANMIVKDKNGRLAGYFKKLIDTLEGSKNYFSRPKKYIAILNALADVALKEMPDEACGTFSERIEVVRKFLGT